MRPSWDAYFLDVAHVVASRATCNRKRVGVVLVRDKRILATGYNGSPPGESHCLDVGCEMVGGHCVRTTHAEVNAVAWAAREGIALGGATLYCTLEPCVSCRKVLATAGVTDWKWSEDYA